MRRRFNRGERVALYLANDGRCGICGAELDSGWHADHVTPYSRGGRTDITNGQALCPTCNLMKGATVTGLREWQAQASTLYFENEPQDFLVCATPGAGKTRFALHLAQRLRDAQVVDRIAVIVPTDSLRMQWADASPLPLMPVSGPEDYTKRDYAGFVATYQQIAQPQHTELCRRAVSSTPTIAIIDEIHHAGDEESWGVGLRRALELSHRRLALTGTPWRRGNSPIPFVRYDDDGRVIVDVTYEYGQAVSDGVCRRIEFDAFDGEAKWQDCGKIIASDLSSDALNDTDRSHMLSAALDPGHQWMRGILAKANERLVDIRSEVPDAGGLVIAYDRTYAAGYHSLLKSITGEWPTLVVSAEPDAQRNLERFRRGHSPWLVAVRMVSEGVDIPRLVVGVYASKIKTPLFFRQTVGRFVRIREAEEINACMFLPAVPSLMANAAQIEEELRHQLEESDRQWSRTDMSGASQLQGAFDLAVTLSTSEPIFDSTILAGDRFSATELETAEGLCRCAGLPLRLASQIAIVARNIQAGVIATPPHRETPIVDPQHRREQVLRGEINKLVCRIAYATGVPPKDVNKDLRRRGFPARPQASISELDEIRAHVLKRLADLP
jgi:superfamily II DNA or RNA helicase